MRIQNTGCMRIRQRSSGSTDFISMRFPLCKKGLECRHNKGYWQRTDYLGLGLGASSLIDHIRFSNTDNMEEYIKNSRQPEKIRCDMERLSETDEMAEFMFLGLRMTEGVSMDVFEEYFGEKKWKVFTGMC